MPFKLPKGLTRGADGLWHQPGEDEVSYPEHGNEACLQVEDQSFWFNHRNRCINTVLKHYPPNGVVVEIGGGNGYVAQGIIRAGHEAIVVEPGLKGARASRDRGIDPVIHGTLQGAGFEDGSIAAVGMFDVLEHIDDHAAMLRDIHRTLVPGGKLFLTVPAHQSLFSFEDRLAGHYRRYTLRSAWRVLEQNGYEVNYITYFFAVLPAPIFLFRTIPTWLGANGGESSERLKSEHVKHGVASKLVDLALGWETAAIDKGYRIPCGSSLLAVASKVV